MNGSFAGPLLAVVGLLFLLTSIWRPSQPLARGAASLAIVAAALLYLAWRLGGIGAMPTTFGAEAVWMWSFLVVEVACFASLLLTATMLSRSTDARRRAEADEGERRLRALVPEDHPEVEVWIATYNEDWDILERTIVGALGIDWPRGRLHVSVHDDGRRDWLAARCADLGVDYVTRPDNRNRKAGNHNHALARARAPFILSIDADFVVYPNILYRTVGLFEDPDVALVQTPQVYFNTDPTRRALGFADVTPAGYDGIDMFYRAFQPSRDAWGASFYCGTSAVLRREALVSIGGFVTETDIEDQATAVKLLAHGWAVRYLNEGLSNGLAAESGTAYHDQRNRWCRGSLQICFTGFGPFGRGLSPMQRLLFLQEDWLLGAIYPIFFALAPAVIWATGWRVFPGAGHAEALMMPLALFAGAILYLTWITHGLWLPVLSQATQLYTAVRLLPTAVLTLVKPFGPSLVKILPVTLKGRDAGTGGLNRPTAAILGSLLAFLVGAMAWRIGFGPALRLDAPEILALLVWSAIDIAILGLALRACIEPDIGEGTLWFDANETARLRASGASLPVRVAALSLDGAVLKGVPAHAGKAFALDLASIGAVEARVLRREGGEVEIAFEAPPRAVRHALIRKLYADDGGEALIPAVSPSRLGRRLASRLLFS